MAYSDFVAKVSVALSLEAGEKPFLAILSPGDKSTVEDVAAIFDRSQELTELQTAKVLQHTTGFWVGHSARMEMMAGWERDSRTRYRSRMSHYLSDLGYAKFNEVVLNRHQQVTENILNSK